MLFTGVVGLRLWRLLTSEYPTIPNPGMLGRLGNPDQYALIDFYGHHRSRGGEVESATNH